MNFSLICFIVSTLLMNMFGSYATAKFIGYNSTNPNSKTSKRPTPYPSLPPTISPTSEPTEAEEVRESSPTRWIQSRGAVAIICGCSFLGLVMLVVGLVIAKTRSRLNYMSHTSLTQSTNANPIYNLMHMPWKSHQSIESSETSDEMLKQGYGSGSTDDSPYRKPPPILIMPSVINIDDEFNHVMGGDVEAMQIHQGQYSPMAMDSTSGKSLTAPKESSGSYKRSIIRYIGPARGEDKNQLHLSESL